MKRSRIVIGFLVVLLVLVAVAPVTAQPEVTFTVLNLPPGGSLELQVGESYTFDILIESNEPFILAMVLSDAYYPGRGVYWHGSDRETHNTSALLHLTVTGKASTAGLWAVCDWPEPGLCWPDGTAPLAIAAGVRFQGGVVVGQQFPFGVVVP